MVKKKIDNRIRVIIENGIKLGHRTMFIIMGNNAKDQVPILYDMLTKSTVKARPNVLWCYKTKDEGISSHGKKRVKKQQVGKINVDDGDMFDKFRLSTTIHGRYYSETSSILGKTYGVCVLQDFEALTPNLLARTVETVEGGGLIILLLKSVSSLKQLYSLSMDVHKRYRTEAHQNVSCRFNERLILSLANCERCLLINDDLTVIPFSSKTAEIWPVDVASVQSKHCEELSELKLKLQDTPPAGGLVNLCKTFDQAKAVAQFIDALAEKNLKPPTSLTAGRGRGKSAAMGLSISAAVFFGYVNIYVTSPHPENLITLFEFILKGFDALQYQEHTDYTIVRSTNPEFKKAIIRINITRNNRQTIQYIAPTDVNLLNAADLLVIDEAAAIPLPLVKKMLGPYLVFMASTINGYEGTGRSLSLKLISQLQKENNASPPIQLDESIRYSPNDPIESWLSSLLCLNVNAVPHLSSGCPTPSACELYYVDRDALFSYHKAAEAFLHRMISIYVSSHYKNSPNDLQMISDAPAHHLFCLLGPITKQDALPEILVVIQVCLEGEISLQSVTNSLARGKKAYGDLIPWTVSEQFNDHQFPKLGGARVVRIATHPSYQRMGYGKHALKLLKDYYEGKFTSLDETADSDDNDDSKTKDDALESDTIEPRKNIPTLLRRLNERRPENLDYIGTSFGLTGDLLKFWKSQQFVPVYLSQKTNEITGEQSCIMLSALKKQNSEKVLSQQWLQMYFEDFRRRIIRLLSKSFNTYTTGLALSLLDNRAVTISKADITQAIVDIHFMPHDIKRLEAYTRNQVDYKLILDLTYDMARLFFENNMDDVQIDALQKAILLGLGLQNKTITDLADEFNMPQNQVLAKFYNGIKKITSGIIRVVESTVEKVVIKKTDKDIGKHLVGLEQTLSEELEKDEMELSAQQKRQLQSLKKESLDMYAIKGTDVEWGNVLKRKDLSLVSVKSGKKRAADLDSILESEAPKAKKEVKKNRKSTGKKSFKS